MLENEKNAHLSQDVQGEEYVNNGTVNHGNISLMPRLVRLREAPGYLGMDKNRFNKEVRPLLTEIPIGKQGVAFDRLELDRWVEHYISCNGRRISNRDWR